MARGSKPGERRGGRKKGVPNHKTRKVIEKAERSGVMPLDVMLDNMRFAHEKAEDLFQQVIGDLSGAERAAALKALMSARQMAQDAAKDAAPYVHPRLASTEAKLSGSITLGDLVTAALKAPGNA